MTIEWALVEGKKDKHYVQANCTACKWRGERRIPAENVVLDMLDEHAKAHPSRESE